MGNIMPVNAILLSSFVFCISVSFSAFAYAQTNDIDKILDEMNTIVYDLRVLTDDYEPSEQLGVPFQVIM